MNANELADELKEYALDNGYSHIDYADSMNQAATMLRQQQAEIEALKADNKRLKGYCWETDEAIEFLKAVKEAQEK